MDSIYALSSGSVPSGVAVVRLSGSRVGSALEQVCGRLPAARFATLRDFKRPADGEVIDRGLLLWFPAPASFTGEDCGELHLHGGKAVTAAIFSVLAAQGLRIAEPGEFTKRAFLNGKLDLTAAEGIADLVGAETEMQRRQALRHAGGALSARTAIWRERLIDLRAEIEARLDFSDEPDVSEDLPLSFWAGLDALREDLRQVLAGSSAGERMRDGFRVAILGRPNAGKSSLLNALARRDVAIVTEEPGTTRDVLEVPLDLGGFPVVLADTAGIRESDSVAEREGVRRARWAGDHADLVLWLFDPGGPEHLPPAMDTEVWAVATKADLYAAGSGSNLQISVKTGTGLSDLEHQLEKAASGLLGGGAALVARERQRHAIEVALACLDEVTGRADEVVADLLRSASEAIGRLSGRVGVEDVLDSVFRDFCIGK